MDDMRTASGVSLKRLYQVFPSKGALVEAYLDAARRAAGGHASPRTSTARTDPGGTAPRGVRLAARAGSTAPDFRGCAFINAFGELGATAPEVAEAARRHKEAFQQYIAGLVSDAGAPGRVAAALHCSPRAP